METFKAFSTKKYKLITKKQTNVISAV